MIADKQTYFGKDIIYQADNCLPLLNAWEAGEITLEAFARLNYPGKRINKKSLQRINTIGYWNAHRNQNWGLNWHRNEGIEITFLESGKLAFTLEEGQHTVMPDEFTITRPWQLHKLGDPTIGVGKLFWLIIDVGVRHPHQEWTWPSWVLLSKEDLRELTSMFRQNEQPILKANTEIKRCFQKLSGLVIGDFNSVKEVHIYLHINELLLNLLEMYRAGSFPLNTSLTESIRTVEFFIKDLNNSFSEPWTLESMAESCKLGTTRFVYYFKQVLNRTPMQHLTILRVEASLKLLASGMPVNKVCYDCGFTSSQYFATVFKQQYGCSPTSYRLKNRP